MTPRLGRGCILLQSAVHPDQKLNLWLRIISKVYSLKKEAVLARESMLTPENNQTEIMRRQSDYKPPRSLSHWLIGRPLMTADAPHQTIGKAVGLAVFASDALSSTAYATQEILGVLIVLGPAAYGYVFSISAAIVILQIGRAHV